LQTYLQQDIGLSNDQIAAIRNGEPVAKTLPSRTPAEVFLFGAVYIHAAPEGYLKFARDFDRLGRLPNYLALTVFSNPPQLSDFKGFSFESDDIEALKDCKPGDCLIQMPTSSIEELQRSINWDADVNQQVNQFLQKTALQRLLAYQREGNQALGVYNDKRNPTEVPRQFAYMLTYAKALPAHLPDFYTYLLAYPNAKPANVEDTFYWARVKFGLKPTLRVVQMVTMRGSPADQVAYAIAEKQLYSSHYFETALDLAILLSAHRHEWWGYYAFMATVGEVLGGYLTYRLAEKGGQKTLEKKVGKSRAEKLYKHFEKRGFRTVLTGSILPPPFPFTSVLMAAGIMQYPRKKFLSALTVGRGVRFFAVAYFGRIYGQQMIGFISRHYRPLMYILIALAVTAGVGALVYFKWYRPKVQREERRRGEQVEEFPVPGRHPRKTSGAE